MPLPQAMMLWMISLVSSRSPPWRFCGFSSILHPGGAICRPKRAADINDRGDPFDPVSRAKWRPHPPIMRTAAAVRRHAVRGVAARANIVN
jgi:hypothetical protein